MLDISAHEVTSAKRTACHVQVRRRVGVTPVKLKPGSKKILEDAENGIHVVFGSSVDISDRDLDLPSVEHEINKEEATCDLRYFTLKDDGAPATL